MFDIHFNTTGITALKKPSNHPEEIVSSSCQENCTATVTTSTQAPGLNNTAKPNTNEDMSCLSPRLVDILTSSPNYVICRILLLFTHLETIYDHLVSLASYEQKYIQHNLQ